MSPEKVSRSPRFRSDSRNPVRKSGELSQGRSSRSPLGSPSTKTTMNLPHQTMDRVYHTLSHQMAYPSALEKGVASLNVMHMHASIAPHLLNEPHGGTTMEEEILMGGTVIGKFNFTN